MFFLLRKARETTTLVISFLHYCFWEMWGTWGKAVFTTLPRRLWSELAADTVPPSTDLGLFISCLLLLPVLGEQRLQGMQIKPGFDPMTSPKISLGWRILSEKEELAFGDSSGEHILKTIFTIRFASHLWVSIIHGSLDFISMCKV